MVLPPINVEAVPDLFVLFAPLGNKPSVGEYSVTSRPPHIFVVSLVDISLSSKFNILLSWPGK